MGKKKGTHLTAPRQEVLGIPEPIWREHWEEVERARALYQEMQVAPSRELERELFGALTHLVGHVSAMWEEAEFLEEDA